LSHGERGAPLRRARPVADSFQEVFEAGLSGIGTKTVRLAVGPVRSTQSRVVQPAAKPVQGGGTQAWRVLGAGP
jgi:hypothetical protein